MSSNPEFAPFLSAKRRRAAFSIQGGGEVFTQELIADPPRGSDSSLLTRIILMTDAAIERVEKLTKLCEDHNGGTHRTRRSYPSCWGRRVMKRAISNDEIYARDGLLTANGYPLSDADPRHDPHCEWHWHNRCNCSQALKVGAIIRHITGDQPND